MPARILRGASVVVLFGVGLMTVTAAQAVKSAFEVASVRRNMNSPLRRDDGARRVGTQPGGRFIMEEGTALVLVRSAFPDAVEIIGAPEWTSSEYYDVQAKAPATATPDEIQGMLRTFLADRFRLLSHYEDRDKPTYSLMLSRSDGRLGPQLRRYDGDCAAYTDAIRTGRAKPDLPVPSNGAIACGYRMTGQQVTAGGIDMPALARILHGYAGRPVFDKTGLTGRYEFTFDTSADVSVFTGVRDQLGLKLEPDRARLPVLVVDRIERPIEN